MDNTVVQTVLDFQWWPIGLSLALGLLVILCLILVVSAGGKDHEEKAGKASEKPDSVKILVDPQLPSSKPEEAEGKPDIAIVHMGYEEFGPMTEREFEIARIYGKEALMHDRAS